MSEGTPTRRFRWMLVLLVPILVGCEGTRLPPTSSGPVARLDGEAIYRGLVLQGGGDRWASTSGPRSPSDLDPGVRASHDRVVDEIGSRDPGFFDRFEAAMTSGDHLVVRDALREALRLTETVALGQTTGAWSSGADPVRDRIRALIEAGDATGAQSLEEEILVQTASATATSTAIDMNVVTPACATMVVNPCGPDQERLPLLTDAVVQYLAR